MTEQDKIDLLEDNRRLRVEIDQLRAERDEIKLELANYEDADYTA